MSLSIGAIGIHSSDDYEYYRIKLELKALGITPTGNRNTDKARLALEKEKLVNKIYKSKNKVEIKDNKDFLETLVSAEQENIERQNMEKEKLGAMTVAELNRYYFKI